MAGDRGDEGRRVGDMKTGEAWAKAKSGFLREWGE